MTENEQRQQVIDARKSLPSAWAQILASVAFSCATYAMLSLYGLVHWNIMFDHKAYPDNTSMTYVYQALWALGILRLVFAALALVFALWSFRGRPQLGSFVALAFAACALFTVFIIM